jgi:hypothetical protein
MLEIQLLKHNHKNRKPEQVEFVLDINDFIVTKR